jgi:hypothetical protein
MVFSRAVIPVQAPGHDALTSALVGIGMRFASAAAGEPNIEDTMFFASAHAMDGDDLRVAAMLVSWFGVHHAWVNADRITRLVLARGSERVRALWAALAHWQTADRRYGRIDRGYRGPRLDLLAAGTEFQIRRHGEDARFEGSCLRVPANTLRDRPGDVAPPEDLARRHRAYHHRVMMGASYRADCWAALEAEPGLSAAELARRTYASFATAWHVKRDFVIVGPVRRRGMIGARHGKPGASDATAAGPAGGARRTR